MKLIDDLRRLYSKMLATFQRGLSSTSTKKFDEIKDFFQSHFSISVNDIYAVGAGTRPANLEVRLSQGIQATKHHATILGLAFIKDKLNTEKNRLKLTQSSFVTVEKFLKRGKASYENILILVESNSVLYVTGLIYSSGSSLKDQLISHFDISILKEVDPVGVKKDDDSAPSLFSSTEVKVGRNIDNIILYGPPGTGKTYKLQHGYGLDANNSVTVTFHQSYCYEEFVEGIKPIITDDKNCPLSYEFSKGVFYKACEDAVKLVGYSCLAECIADTIENRVEKFEAAIKSGKYYTVCIDEINRANIAGVFGDLISLIEVSKRLGCADDELIIELPYSKSKFGVPLNLQIIGTMNTADRSITLIDTALRRRFVFSEMPADYEILEDMVGKIGKIDVPSMLLKINQRISYLLSKDHCIGHTYFLLSGDKLDLLRIFINKIIPLLEEYFYNDYNKIKLVLGEGGDVNEELDFFIRDERLSLNNLFSWSNNDIDIEDKVVYVKNPRVYAFLDKSDADIPDSIFTKIYS